MGLRPTFFMAFEFGEQRQCILYTLKVIKDYRSSLKLTFDVTMLQKVYLSYSETVKSRRQLFHDASSACSLDSIK